MSTKQHRSQLELLARLTATERRVAAAAARLYWLKVADVAVLGLGMRPGTAAKHLKSAYRVLGVASRVHLLGEFGPLLTGTTEETPNAETPETHSSTEDANTEE